MEWFNFVIFFFVLFLLLLFNSLFSSDGIFSLSHFLIKSYGTTHSKLNAIHISVYQVVLLTWFNGFGFIHSTKIKLCLCSFWSRIKPVDVVGSIAEWDAKYHNVEFHLIACHEIFAICASVYVRVCMFGCASFGLPLDFPINLICTLSKVSLILNWNFVDRFESGCI